MNKDELNLLLEIINNKKILTTKATNASNNRLKEEAWKTIANDFGAQVGESQRPEQLRFKWENVKKAARKRSAAIRQNNLKTGGGKSYIPPDCRLSSVCRLPSKLGAKCSGYTVEFGGDGVDSAQGNVMEVSSLPDLELQFKPQSEADIVAVLGDGSRVGGLIVPRAVLFDTPKNSQDKRRKHSEEVLRAQKDKELAAYFQAKTEKLRLENEK